MKLGIALEEEEGRKLRAATLAKCSLVRERETKKKHGSLRERERETKKKHGSLRERERETKKKHGSLRERERQRKSTGA